MGWDCRDIQFNISLHLDSHGGQKERDDEKLADEFERNLKAAMRTVLADPRYRGILLFEPDYYLGEEGGD